MEVSMLKSEIQNLVTTLDSILLLMKDAALKASYRRIVEGLEAELEGKCQGVEIHEKKRNQISSDV
jgi:hypothetical protein